MECAGAGPRRRSRCAFREQSEFAQHLLRMLPEQRRRPVEAQRRVGEPDRADHLRHAAGERMRQVSHISRCCICGSSNTCGMVLIGPARHAGGIQRGDERVRAPTWRRPRHSSAVSSALARTRGGVGREARGVAPGSASPITSHSFANWPSLPTASTKSPSAQANTSCGWMLGCRLPLRCGVLPETR